MDDWGDYKVSLRGRARAVGRQTSHMSVWGSCVPTHVALLDACVLRMQSSSGAASTLDRLTKETDTNITQVHADVTAKKSLVSFDTWQGLPM